MEECLKWQCKARFWYMLFRNAPMGYAFVYKWLSREERPVGNLAGGGHVMEWYIYDYLEPAGFRNIMEHDTHSLID